jgi:hypothetical protein
MVKKEDSNAPVAKKLARVTKKDSTAEPKKTADKKKTVERGIKINIKVGDSKKEEKPKLQPQYVYQPPPIIQRNF